jgi:hypothetical protein
MHIQKIIIFLSGSNIIDDSGSISFLENYHHSTSILRYKLTLQKIIVSPQVLSLTRDPPPQLMHDPRSNVITLRDGNGSIVGEASARELRLGEE